MFGGEGGEHVDRIVADGHDRDAVSFVIVLFALQLNELRLAVWSPACAAIEDDRSPAISPVVMKVNELTVLIQKCDVREA